jgi:hypothetical protein
MSTSTATDALTAMIAMTEQVVGDCDCGLATTEQVTSLVQRRAVHLSSCSPDCLGAPVSDSERALVSRLADLDDALVRWCSAAQRELEQRRSQIPNAASGTAKTRLSDIA